jgi:AP-2 complex subunit alpha
MENIEISIDPSLDLNISVVQAMESKSIREGGQELTMYNVECVGPFSIIPWITLTYQIAELNCIKREARFPVTIFKFIEPVTLSLVEFHKRWGQIGGGTRESIEAFSQTGEIDLPSLLTGCNLGIIESGETACLMFAGVFSSTGSGKVGCLLRIDVGVVGEVSEYRIVDRTTHEKVSECLGGSLKSIITGEWRERDNDSRKQMVKEDNDVIDFS